MAAAQVGIGLLLARSFEHWWICCLLLLLRVVREWRLRARLRDLGFRNMKLKHVCVIFGIGRSFVRW